MTPGLQHDMGRHRRSRVLACTLLALALLVSGCRREPPATPPNPPKPMRIVCLSPAVTDLLLALDLGACIVGRDTWEEQLPESVPRVGDLTSVNLEAVIALEPTDVVLQAGRLGSPPRVEEVAAERGWNFINLQIDGLADIRSAITSLAEDLSYRQDPALGAEVKDRSRALVDAIDAALVPLPDEVTAELGPILNLYFTEPPSAFGPGSYVSDVLESLGARNALSGGAWQELDLERVAAIDPWALIVARPDAIGRPADAIGSLERLDLQCVRSGRVALLRHPRSQLPGASVIGVATELRTVLTDLARAAKRAEP